MFKVFWKADLMAFYMKINKCEHKFRVKHFIVFYSNLVVFKKNIREMKLN